MGDRTYTHYDCPKCGAKNGVEIYDAPSCLLYVEACQHCDFKVDLQYYETDPNTIELLSTADAKKRGLDKKYSDQEDQDDDSVREIELGD